MAKENPLTAGRQARQMLEVQFITSNLPKENGTHAR